MEARIDLQSAEVKSLLTAVAARYGNMRPVFRDVGEIMTRRVDDRFAAERDPDGNPWLPLKVRTYLQSYLRTGKGRKEGAYTQGGQMRTAFASYLENRKILQQTGALRGDIHYQSDDTHVEWGTSGRLPYAGIQQFGGMAGRGRKVEIPARPYLGHNAGDTMEIAPGDQQAALDAIAAYLNP
jgi:phage gpG-like protein